ncbi:hypothetical protein FGG79_02730 [Bacillus sp. BHET2]|uniref:hypothetical protein n=1 Tax=Bacillus sp. BHET2 TaxID=2583818 RepID=UPI00110D8521|nr:hypothetical protein [Bacillus sp. BHET2]TMU87071.1 hypothetical protein FGG79_02730 [Bacillus sp. BHET2]
MKKQMSIIVVLSFLFISVLFYIGPFEQALWLQFVFLFSTILMAHSAYKNGYSIQFTTLSICSLVSFSSIAMILLS